jgi:superfamily II DNA or RNA helicase
MAETQQRRVQVDDLVQVYGRPDLGVGEVLHVRESGGVYEADVAFEGPDGRVLQSFPLDRLDHAPDLFQRLEAGDFDDPLDFLLKQLAYQFPLQNSGGELSNSRTDLLPHQILLTHDVVGATRRRFLIADEVGLGKTIEAGMIIRELVARGEAERVLVICPAGLTRNWQQELRDCFRMHFEILGYDFHDVTAEAWDSHNRVIASIDTLKRPRRMERLLSAPRWDVIVIDEAHHLTRKRYGNRITATQNYRFAEALRGQTRDLLFLSATPHQGDGYQFWSLIQLLDDQLFEGPEALLDHRGLLNRVMFRRTKREVTYADGTPIFMRRQVHSQKFPMAARERAFYERLTEYLREGYSAAGLGQARTTSRQRAVGFVMATFQKIMSSSPRAIKQALRRRLLVLLAREHMALDAEKARGSARAGLAERMWALQEEMRRLAVDILGLPASPTQTAEADAYIAKVKQAISRRAAAEEVTPWALDGDEEAEDVIFAEADIPQEAEKVRELIRLVPEGPDRKFDTLVRAIEQLRRVNPGEKFVIFTQYRETLEFLREELGRLYGPERIATIKGGPIEDKIAAMESFWQPDGAQFLVSTSAGGEGINLQVCRVLFNYDLPWNPMAIEQRIGRIHRYGQADTVQVYNLVAEDTVEERIYDLLERKLREIAMTIGKVDPVSGEVAEDFRSEILGFLGSSPNYQELYKKALVDRDYQRTEREIAEAVEKARQASEALRTLTQELDTFNLQHYRELQGQFALPDLRTFVEKAVLRLGGTFLPAGEFFRIETPSQLLRYSRVAPRYERVTFDRQLAMRRRGADLLGLGHPLVDALLQYLQSGEFRGEVTSLRKADIAASPAVSVRYLVTAELDSGVRLRQYEHAVIGADGSWTSGPDRLDVELLQNLASGLSPSTISMEDLRQRIASGIAESQSRLRSRIEGIASVRARVAGIAILA